MANDIISVFFDNLPADEKYKLVQGIIGNIDGITPFQKAQLTQRILDDYEERNK